MVLLPITLLFVYIELIMVIFLLFKYEFESISFKKNY